MPDPNDTIDPDDPASSADSNLANPLDELFDFPCDFPIKIMGAARPDFADAIATLLEGFDPGFDRTRIVERASSSARYLGLTCYVMALNRAHLDEIYRALTSHPMVKIVF
ncbi:MAG: YbeD family protein [Janthinobacterium lividum]